MSFCLYQEERFKDIEGGPFNRKMDQINSKRQ